MSAGTISLTNASTAVTGTDTTLTADLTAGDFIVTTVAGVTYTLPVLSVDSDTGATLVSNYTGPTTSAAAWSAVPRATLNQITAALVAQTTEAMRGLNYDKQNWQQIFTGTETITVTLPDGSQYSGPAWNDLSNQLTQKANTSELGDSATLDVGTVAGTVAAGDDSRFSTVGGKSGGTITGDLSLLGALTSQGGGVGTHLVALQNAGYTQSVVIDSSAQSAIYGYAYKYNNGSGYELNTGFGAVGTGSTAWPVTAMIQTANDASFGSRVWSYSMATGDITCTGDGTNQLGTYIFTKAASSDRNIKHAIIYNEGLQSYENIKKIKPCTFIYNHDKKERIRRGVIAQDVREIDEDYVKEVQNILEGTSTLALDTNVLLLDAILALRVALLKIEELEGVVKQLASGS